MIERFPVTDPRSERISAGPRRALHERAQQHYIGGGTEKTIVLKQAALADEQHRIRRQQSRRADHTRDRRGKAVESQSYRNRRLEWEKNDVNSATITDGRRSLFKLCVLRSIFSDNGVNTTEVVILILVFFSWPARSEEGNKQKKRKEEKKEKKKEQNENRVYRSS